MHRMPTLATRFSSHSSKRTILLRSLLLQIPVLQRTVVLTLDCTFHHRLGPIYVIDAHRSSIPVADSVTDDFPLALLTIKDTNPIWVYCRQATHCQQGMVFAVNPGDKFAQFQAAATAGSSSVSASVSSASSTATTAAAATAVVTVTATVTVSSGQTVTTTYASYPGSAAPTSASSQDHSVIVGGTGGLLTYSPSNITAQPGDTVTFEFHQKNHTVTASSFAQPCRALSLTSTTGQVGFDSGL